MSAFARPQYTGGAVTYAWEIPLAIRCGISARCIWLGTQLAQQGFVLDATAELCLILDVPIGFALATLLQSMEHPAQYVVVTDNTCPEYWEDLGDAGAQIVITGDYADYPLASALRHAAAGMTYRVTPERATTLTQIERQALHLLACGDSSQQIAEHLQLAQQTVRNMLTAIYRKLGVDNRHAAQNYYWGICPAVAFRRTMPPEPPI